MEARGDTSYRRVRRGLLRTIGGPAMTGELYRGAGYRRVLVAARNGTLDPALGAALAGGRYRPAPVHRPPADAAADDETGRPQPFIDGPVRPADAGADAP